MLLMSGVEAYTLYQNLCFPLSEGTPCINWTGSQYEFSGVFVPSNVTDTNAGTICNGNNTYLDGDGNCDDFTALYVSLSDVVDFISWNSSADRAYTDSVVSGNVSDLNSKIAYVRSHAAGWVNTSTTTSTALNVTSDIDFCLTTTGVCLSTVGLTTYYFSDVVDSVVGTLSGNLNSTYSFDSVSLNITEESSSPGVDVRFNLTVGDSVNQILVGYKSSSTENHLIYFQLFNYNTSAWKTFGFSSFISEFIPLTFPILNSDDYIKSNVVQLRLYQPVIGNPSHTHSIDFLSVSNGFATPSSEEFDPYFFSLIGNYLNATQTYTFLSGNVSAERAISNTAYVNRSGDLMYGNLQINASLILKATDGDTYTLFPSTSNILQLKTAMDFSTDISGGWVLNSDSATNTTPTLIPSNLDTNTGIGDDVFGDSLSLISGGVHGMSITETAGNIFAKVYGDLNTTGNLYESGNRVSTNILLSSNISYLEALIQDNNDSVTNKFSLYITLADTIAFLDGNVSYLEALILSYNDSVTSGLAGKASNIQLESNVSYLEALALSYNDSATSGLSSKTTLSGVYAAGIRASDQDTNTTSNTEFYNLTVNALIVRGSVANYTITNNGSCGFGRSATITFIQC